jgi:hypothetical protein
MDIPTDGTEVVRMYAKEFRFFSLPQAGLRDF